MSFSTILSEVAEIIMGQSPNGEDVNEKGNGVPLLNGPTEFTSYYPVPVQFTTEGRKFSEPGDILFCVRGSTTGKMNYSDQKYAIGRGLAVIRGKNGYPTHYIRALIEKNLEELLQAATGSTFPSVGRELLLNMKVDVVSESEASIVGIFFRVVEEKIELNRQINQSLEQMAQAIFKSWFVDFDPVRAKFEGRQPEGMDAETAALFPYEFEESQLGNIPKGWTREPLSAYLDIKRGGSPRPIQDFIAPTGYPWVKIADATSTDNPFLFSTKECIRKEGLRKTVLLPPGSLILSNSATPGLPRFLELEACIHDGWLYFPKVKLFTKEYLYLLFQTQREHFISQGNGSIFTNLKTDILKNYLAVIPSMGCINAFNRIIDPIFEAIKYNTKQNHTLSSIRDSLLPKLLAGELTLTNFSH